MQVITLLMSSQVVPLRELFASLGATLVKNVDPSGNEIESAVISAADASADILIVDPAIWGADDRRFIDAMNRLRISAPNVRPIVLVEERVATPLTKALGAMAIYDIVEKDDTAALATALHTPATYAEAASLQAAEDLPENVPTKRTGPLITIGSPKTKTEVVEKLVEVEKLVGTSTIVVSGARDRVGTTQVSLALASWLQARYGNTALLLDGATEFNAIEQTFPDLEKLADGGTVFEDLVIYTEAPASLSRYNYIVVDGGVFDITDTQTIANLRMIVMCASEWDLLAATDLLRQREDISGNVMWCANLCTKSFYEEYVSDQIAHSVRVPFISEWYDADAFDEIGSEIIGMVSR